ncbi:MAG: exonuclease subunit SbcD, partial [Chlorobiales bacterium]|nr:exonuclease subunit SbcD [Chlorobiales bacterium]
MKILHTADIHIGYKTHGVIDPKSGLNSRLDDFERCFRYMVAHAISEGVDLVLFCGDAYRDMNPSQTDQRIFARCLKPLLDRDIPVVMIVGNHDHPYTFGKVNSMEIFSLFSDS